MKALIAASCVLMIGAPLPGSASPYDEEAPPVEECPEAFRGAMVRAAKVPGGVRLDFRNGNKGSVAKMRDQLRMISAMIEQQGTERQTAGETDEVEFPPVDIDVKDIVLGARVTVRASRLRDLPAIRELAFSLEELWERSACNQPLVARN